MTEFKIKHYEYWLAVIGGFILGLMFMYLYLGGIEI